MVLIEEVEERMAELYKDYEVPGETRTLLEEFIKNELFSA